MRFFRRAYIFKLLLPLFAFNANIGWSKEKNMPTISEQKLVTLNTDELERNRSVVKNHSMTSAKLKLLRRAIERNPLEMTFIKNRFQSEEDKFMFSFGGDSPSGVVERNATTSGLKNVILRSLSGKNISIAILGGSISAGGGLHLDEEDFRGLYYRVFADWWQQTVQPFTGSNAILHNLAVGGTSSNFFAFCYKALINPVTDVDIALLDFTVNDYMLFKDSKFPIALSLEQLTREILSNKKPPALIFVNFVRGVSKTPMCNNLENHGQTTVADNYGITSVSLRNFFCSGHSGKSEMFKKMFTSDGTHASVLAHSNIALMIINYVRQTMLKVLDWLDIPGDRRTLVSPSLHSNDSAMSSRPKSFHVKLPEALFEENRAEFHDTPLCYTQITPDGTKNESIHQTLQVNEVGNLGFHFMPKQYIKQPGEANRDASQHFHHHKSRTDAYGGWKAQSVNSMLELAILIPLTLKDKQILTRNIAIAIRTHSNGGTARVWLDEYEEKGVLINTRSPFGHTRLHTIARHVTPGRHVLSVRTETPGIFILSAIMTGPTYN